MTGREKIEAAFSRNGTPEVPAVICYEGIFIRDHWEQLTSCPWWYQFSPDLGHQLAWRRDVIEAIDQDWFALPFCHSRRQREELSVEERSDGVFLVNRRTGQEEELERPLVAGWSPTGKVQSHHPDRLADTFEEIDRLVPLPPEGDPAEMLTDGRGDLAARMLEEFGRRLFPIQHVSSPLWQCYGLWGFEGMMLMIAERPDLVRRACERFFSRSVAWVRQAAALGAAGIWIEECMTDVIAPEAFEALHLPFLRRLTCAIRQGSMKSIYYFCGNPAGKWDLLLSTGADALSLEEGKKNFTIEIEEVAARAAGRCALLGNLDALDLLARGSEAELRRQIARQVAAGRKNGGRFILSLGSPVTPQTPAQRVRRYCQLARQTGGAG